MREFNVYDGAELSRFRHDDFPRLRPDGYKQTRKGFFLLKGEDKIAFINIAKDNMRGRTEREIRTFLGLPDSENYVPPEPKPPFNPIQLPIKADEKPEQETTVNTTPAPTKQKFNVSISALLKKRSAFIIYAPAFLLGKRFSVIFVDGKLLLSQDDKGNVFSAMSIGYRVMISYSTKKWFKGTYFQDFKSMTMEAEMDEHGIEIKLPDWALGDSPRQQLKLPEPVKMPDRETVSGPAPILEGPVAPPPVYETERDKAARYLRWLNNFCQANDYTIKTDNNRLMLERQDRIA